MFSNLVAILLIVVALIVLAIVFLMHRVVHKLNLNLHAHMGEDAHTQLQMLERLNNLIQHVKSKDRG